jgi:hypothetical protein
MAEQSLGSIHVHFSQGEDPGIDRNKLRSFVNIIGITICAVICGAENWVDVELDGNLKKDWLGKNLDLSNGVPSHDTFGRVFGG